MVLVFGSYFKINIFSVSVVISKTYRPVLELIQLPIQLPPWGLFIQGHRTDDPLISITKVMSALSCICTPPYVFKAQDKSLPWTFTTLKYEPQGLY